MSLHHSPLQKTLSNSRRASLHPKDHFFPSAGCSDAFLIQLKQNYHERILSLEHQVKQTYRNIEADELLNTMEMSEVSKEFRHQRIQEIVGESLMAEKESYLAHLSEVNAQLKADVVDAENETLGVLDELENKKKDEAILRQENDSLKDKIVQLREELEYKDKQSMTTDSSHMSTLTRLNFEKDEFQREIKRLEQKIIEKDKLYNELKHDLEVVQGHFGRIEKDCAGFDSENRELKACLRELEEFRERHLGFEDDFKLTREKLRYKEEELNLLRSKLEDSGKENVQLKERNDVIIQENQKAQQKDQVSHTQTLEELRLKYRNKVKKYQQKTDELSKKNEELFTQMLGMKNASEENIKLQDIIKRLREDIEDIESRWTRKYRDLESHSQEELSEERSRNEVKIKQLEAEYQVFMQSKLAEVQRMAKELAAHRESEARSEYENKLTEFSHNFIPKSDHDMILATETDNLKSAHIKAIQALYDEFGREANQKMKKIQKKEKEEYNIIINELQERRQNQEIEISRLKDENKFLLNKKSDQAKLIKQLKDEIEANNTKAKGLSREINQTAEDYLKSKTQLETQAKRSQAMEAKMIDLLKKIDEQKKKNDDLEAHINKMNEDLKVSGNAQNKIHENFIQEKLNNDGLLEEIESLSRRCEVVADERDQVLRELEQVKEELTNDVKRLQQRIHDYKREIEEKEKFTKNLLNTNKKLEESVENLQYREKGLKIELATSQGEYMKLEAKVANQSFDHKLNISKLLKLVSAQIAYIKKEAESIKNSAKFEIDVAHKVTKAAIEDFSNNLSNQLKSVRIRNVQENAARLEGHRKETEKYQDSVQAYIEENKELINENDDLNKQLVKALDALDVSKVAILDYKRKLELANDEIYKLKDIEVERIAEIEQIKLVIDEQFINMKGELKGRVPEIIKNLQAKHKAEISHYVSEINQVKQSKEEGVMELKHNMQDLEINFGRELEETKRNYQQKIIQGEEKIMSLRKQYEAEAKDNHVLKEQLKEFKGKCHQLDQEQRELIAGYEVKVEEIEKTVQKNNEELQLEKDQSWKEVERLNKEVLNLRRNLNGKNEELINLDNIRKEQSECISKYRVLEHKQKLNIASGKEAVKSTMPLSARKIGELKLQDLASSRSTAASGFYSSRKNY